MENQRNKGIQTIYFLPKLVFCFNQNIFMYLFFTCNVAMGSKNEFTDTEENLDDTVIELKSSYTE